MLFFHALQEILFQIHVVESGGVDLYLVLDEKLVQPCALLQAIQAYPPIVHDLGLHIRHLLCGTMRQPCTITYLSSNSMQTLQNQWQRALAVVHLYLEVIPAVLLQALPVYLLYQVPLLDDAVMGGHLAQLA